MSGSIRTCFALILSKELPYGCCWRGRLDGPLVWPSTATSLLRLVCPLRTSPLDILKTQLDVVLAVDWRTSRGPFEPQQFHNTVRWLVSPQTPFTIEPSPEGNLACLRKGQNLRSSQETKVTEQPTVNLSARLSWLVFRWVGSMYFQLQLEGTLWLYSPSVWLPILNFMV